MEKRNHEPIRSCVVCRSRLPKHLLNRYVCDTGQRPELVGDPDQVLPGRGYYVCGKDECAEKFPRYQGWRKKCKGVAHDKNQS